MTARPRSRSLAGPSLPGPGTYRVPRAERDAVARCTVRTGAGPVHLRLPVVGAALLVSSTAAKSWIEVELDASGLTSSLPLAARRRWEGRLRQALGAVRLETFALAEPVDGRMRADAELYVGDSSTDVTLDCRVAEAGDSDLRLAVAGRFSRTALGLGGGRRLVADSVRFVIAFHAVSDTTAARVGTAA